MGKPNPVYVRTNTPEALADLAERVASLAEFRSRHLTGKPVEPGRQMRLHVPGNYPFRQVRASDYVIETFEIPFAYHHPSWGWNMVDRRVLAKSGTLTKHWSSVLRHYRLIEEILTDPAFVAADVKARLADVEADKAEAEQPELVAVPEPDWEELRAVLGKAQPAVPLPRWRPVTARVNTYHLVREDDASQTRCGLPVIVTGPDASPEPVASRASLPPGSRECPFCRTQLAVA